MAVTNIFGYSFVKEKLHSLHTWSVVTIVTFSINLNRKKYQNIKKFKQIKIIKKKANMCWLLEISYTLEKEDNHEDVDKDECEDKN